MLVYRTASWKRAAAQFEEIRQRQNALRKQFNTKLLNGNEACPAKAEYQQNISAQLEAKREVYRVSNLYLFVVFSLLRGERGTQGVLTSAFKMCFNLAVSASIHLSNLNALSSLYSQRRIETECI